MARSRSRRPHADHVPRSTGSDLGKYTEDFLGYVVVLSVHQENVNKKQKIIGIPIAHIGRL
jgi:selenophosphate synthetase-related protein